MGHHYGRIALNGGNSRGSGTAVPPALIVSELQNVLGKIQNKPTCVLPSVIRDPFLMSDGSD
jgi:hypothetical protein